jgi:hypothetical protein
MSRTEFPMTDEINIDDCRQFRIFGASDDHVVVQEVNLRSARVPEVEVDEDKDGNPIFNTSLSGEKLRDEDGNIKVVERVIKVHSFLSLSGTTLNINDTLMVEVDHNPDSKSWTLSMTPHTDVSDIGGETYMDVADIPETWNVAFGEKPESVDAINKGDSFTSLCLHVTLPEEDADFERV